MITRSTRDRCRILQQEVRARVLSERDQSENRMRFCLCSAYS